MRSWSPEGWQVFSNDFNSSILNDKLFHASCKDEEMEQLVPVAESAGKVRKSFGTHFPPDPFQVRLQG